MRTYRKIDYRSAGRNRWETACPLDIMIIILMYMKIYGMSFIKTITSDSISVAISSMHLMYNTILFLPCVRLLIVEYMVY